MRGRLSPTSLKDFVLLSWLIPGGLAVCASLIAFLVIGAVDYRNSMSRTITDLNDKAKIAARRLSGELLLGSAGSVESVSLLLQRELEVDQVTVQEKIPHCLHQNKETCSAREGAQVAVYRPVAGLLLPHFVRVTSPRPSYLGSLKPVLLLWSTLPVLLLLGLGLFFQRLYLRRYIVRPIESLVETTLQQREPPAHWPTELRTIAAGLSESFEAREQAVFGQLARGVVHDIKTLLHSLVTATELVHEQPEGSQKRSARMEALLRAATANLPKMRQIIEQTLDGSREIPVQPRTHDLAVTIQNALSVTRDLATARKVNVEYEGPSSLLVKHDPVQLERALVNMLKNGIEAHDGLNSERGVVLVSALALPDSSAQITVEDSGTGLPDQPGLVFKPLRSKKVHGSGLGLVISRKIIEAHGGSIHAKSTGRLGGALFEVRFPSGSVVGGVQ